MKQFIYGLLSGIGLVLLWNQFTSTPEVKKNKQVVIPIVNLEYPATVTAKKDLSVKSINKIKAQVLQSKDKNIVDNDTNLNSLSKSRQEFNDLAANISDAQLLEAKTMLDSILEIKAQDLFDSESRNEAVALERENELEVKFYEKSPYDGNSKITSIECRSTLCKVELSVPDNASYSPFPLLNWDSSMKSSQFHKKTKNNETPSMTVYYGIVGDNFPDKGFDLKYTTKK